MGKAFAEQPADLKWPKSKVPHNITKQLAENNACYVLITCGEPTEDGKMEVEMTYEGDEILAAYLIESAQGFIDQQGNAT